MNDTINAIGVVAHLVIAFACVLNGVLVLMIRRLFQWPDVRLLCVLFGATLLSGAGAHVTRAYLIWWYPNHANLAHVLFAALCAAFLLASGGLLFSMVQGRQSMLISRLREIGVYLDTL